MNLFKKNLFQYNTQFKAVKCDLVFFSVFCFLLFPSCSSWVSYNKNGSNDIGIYQDSLIKIQRSTEVLGDLVLVSHIVTRKDSFPLLNVSVTKITNKINGISPKDSLSFFESCSLKKYLYKTFNEIPENFINFHDCLTYQIIFYYNKEDIDTDKLVALTKIGFSVDDRNYLISTIDTLIKDVQYHLPQP